MEALFWNSSLNSTYSADKLDKTENAFQVSVKFPLGMGLTPQTKTGFDSAVEAQKWVDWFELQLTERYCCSRARIRAKGFEIHIEKRRKL